MTEISKVSLLLVDSLRYDCVGYQPDKKFLKHDNVLDLLFTPNIDKISKESVCFTRCYSTSSLTPQVLASMFTGTTQVNHNVRLNTDTGRAILHKNTITIAEILKKEGFLTVFTSELPKHLKIPNLMRGFDHEFSQDDKRLFSFLAKHEDEKIFLFCDFEDVHSPYLHSDAPPWAGYNDDFFSIMNELFKRYNLQIPNEPWEYWSELYKVEPFRKTLFPLYVKGVSKFDKGRFKFFIDSISSLGFTDPKNSIMIITSDHGDGKTFSDKPNHFGHGGEGYEEVSRVPLIVKIPGLKNEIRDDLVSNMDIFRIILDTCIGGRIKEFVNYKIHAINPFHGKRDFAWYIFSRRSFHQNPLQSHLYTRIIITKDKKYKLFGKPETFLDSKIFELNNEEFLSKLYDILFVRPSNESEIKRNLSKLEDGTITKKQLYEKFLDSPEYAKKKPFSIFDLMNDPFEEKPIDASRDLQTLQEYSKFLELLLALEKPDEEFKEVHEESVDAEKDKELREELHKLGYI